MPIMWLLRGFQASVDYWRRGRIHLNKLKALFQLRDARVQLGPHVQWLMNFLFSLYGCGSTGPGAHLSLPPSLSQSPSLTHPPSLPSSLLAHADSFEKSNQNIGTGESTYPGFFFGFVRFWNGSLGKSQHLRLCCFSGARRSNRQQGVLFQLNSKNPLSFFFLNIHEV